jgi:hypothetical protein
LNQSCMFDFVLKQASIQPLAKKQFLGPRRDQACKYEAHYPRGSKCCSD